MGFNIDAEEADRLSLSLDVIEAVLSDPRWRAGTGLAWWCRPMARAPAGDRLALCDWPNGSTARSWCGWSRAPIGTPRSSARRSRRRRLSGLHPQGRHRCQLYRQRAQTAGHDRPDLSAVRHPQRPYRRRDPAHGGRCETFEFQRLHGMGEALHDIVLKPNRPAAASMRRSARIATCWPIWCGACWKTAPTLVRQPDRRRRRAPEVVAADPFDALQTKRHRHASRPGAVQPERPIPKALI